MTHTDPIKALVDHPFDEIAVEQLARHMAEAAGFKSHDWAPFRTRANLALTAACKSMKKRGKAIDVQYQDDAHPFRPQSNTPVTIFQHGE